MADNYTPDDDFVRNTYANERVDSEDSEGNDDFDVFAAYDEFDRWFAEVQRKAKEEAWDEFVDILSAHHEDHAPAIVLDMEHRNPHRSKEESND